jgi:hypothetical protein
MQIIEYVVYVLYLSKGKLELDHLESRRDVIIYAN